jgi:tetratricopeptide (TPR) repeat protein
LYFSVPIRVSIRLPISRAALLAMCGAFLSACAQAPASDAEPSPSMTEHAEEPADADEAQAGQAHVEPLPNLELSGQILYQVLLAEIAYRRGNTDLAVSAYLDLARKTRDPRIAKRAAELAHATRQPRAALEAVRLWVEIDPESSQARHALVGLLAASNQLDEIPRHAAFLLGQEPTRQASALLGLNRLFARHPDRKAVKQLIDQLTEPYLNYPEARLARAQAALSADETSVALEESAAALRLRPDWEPAVSLHAQAQAREAPDQAIETLAEYLARNPQAADLRLQYARLLTAQRQYERARDEFQTLLKSFPNNGDIIFAVSVLSFQLKDYDTSEAGFRRLAESSFQDQNTVRMYLGQIAEQRARPDEAIQWYGAVTEGNQYLGARTRQAAVLAKQGKLEEGRRHLRETTAAGDDERLQLLLAESQLLREAGHTREAFELLNESLGTQPDQPELLYESALLAERIGRGDVLETNLRKLIRIKPDHAHAYNALGYSLADRNERLDEAQQLIAKALSFAPDDPFILDSMGWVLYRKGDLDGAIEYLQRAMRLRADPEIAAHLGEVQWMMGRKEAAAKTWRDAAREHPDNEVLGAVIKRFLP